MSTLCVLVPDWPLEVARKTGRLPPGDDEHSGVVAGGRIVALSASARDEGVAYGQRRREAEAICPTLSVTEADPGTEAVAFEAIALAVEALIPRVEVARPGVLYASATGALRYYGGADATAGAVLSVLRSVAPKARVAIAGGPFVAEQAAALADPGASLVISPGDDASVISGLPIGQLLTTCRRGPDADQVRALVDALHHLGIGTLGALAALPRAAVSARFGATGVWAQRLSCTEDRPIAARSPVEDLSVELEFDDPLTDLETAAFAGKSLAARLFGALSERGLNAFAIEVSFPPLARTWRSLDPLSERAIADRARWQVTAWSEMGLLPGGLTMLRLTPLDVSGSGRQLSLFSDAAADAEAARAYARVQALLGPDAVRHPVFRGGRLPSQRIRWLRHGEPDPGPDPRGDTNAPWPGRLPDPPPALVPVDARAVEVVASGPDNEPLRVGSEDVIARAGPWRIRSSWWEQGGGDNLQMWQVVTASGARLLARDRMSAWTVHGIYD